MTFLQGDKHHKPCNDGETYMLHGAVSHVGTIQAGHYYSYHLAERSWHKIDDNTVSI